jgi:LmbE family N-acetylglucosaminyl deacetylase
MMTQDQPHLLQSYAFPESWALLVLAPHPDDFDAIGVTMRYFHGNGNPLHVAVATSGASGVEDSFCSPPTTEAKGQLREQEQRGSLQFFGLPESNSIFLRLGEDRAGHPTNTPANLERIRQCFLSIRPVLVFLPHGNDTNLGHQRIYAMFHQVAWDASYPLAAFLNRDPKTVQMRCDLILPYGEETANWKGQLLRFHQSQHQRNLNARGHGFDERILSMDRQNAEAWSPDAAYAEAFEVEFFGAKGFHDLPGWQGSSGEGEIWGRRTS